jgi:hypothetical protein
MKICCSLVLVILLLTVCILPWAAQAQQTDIRGWDKLTWGMTMAEVRKVYPGTYPANLADKSFKLQASGPMIAGYPFTVGFAFDNNDRLFGINLRLANEQDANEATYRTLENLLTAKYGLPAKRDKDIGYYMGSVTLTTTWVYPSTIIELCLMNVMNKIKLLSINYRQAAIHGL